MTDPKIRPPHGVDPETGEIIHDDHADIPGQRAAVEPANVVKGSELARLPEDFTDLAAFFAQEEPTPREVMSWILEPDQMQESDPEEATRAILARILTSETAEDVLATSTAVHAQDLLGVPLEVQGIKWQRSDFQEGTSCYVVMQVTDLNDQTRKVVTCGGKNVMTQLLKLQMLGAFPARARIAKALKPTRNNYYPLWLEPA